jgi:hypothetical protein
MQNLLATSIFVLHFYGAFFSQETKYDFILTSKPDSFRLESCIPEDLYSPRLMLPGGDRRIVKADVNNPPIHVIGSSWVNNCLIVEYTDSELPDEDWIDLIRQFTVLSTNQINLVHKKL